MDVAPWCNNWDGLDGIGSDLQVGAKLTNPFVGRSWEGDPNIPAKDQRRQALTASELALMHQEAESNRMQHQEAERVGTTREKKLKRIRPFFKNPFHSLRK